MCQFEATYFARGCEWVPGSSYKLCVDRLQGCKKEIKLIEWRTWCPRVRKAMEVKSSRKMAPPCVDNKYAMDEQVTNEWCSECNPEILDERERPKRCGRPECIVVEPTKGEKDPQVEWEEFLVHWPARHRHRYERHRDVTKQADIKEVSQWASSFTST